MVRLQPNMFILFSLFHIHYWFFIILLSISYYPCNWVISYLSCKINILKNMCFALIRNEDQHFIWNHYQVHGGIPSYPHSLSWRITRKRERACVWLPLTTSLTQASSTSQATRPEAGFSAESDRKSFIPKHEPLSFIPLWLLHSMGSRKFSGAPKEPLKYADSLEMA